MEKKFAVTDEDIDRLLGVFSQLNPTNIWSQVKKEDFTVKRFDMGFVNDISCCELTPEARSRLVKTPADVAGVVVKFKPKQFFVDIDRLEFVANNAIMSELGITPRLLYIDADCMINEYVPSRNYKIEEDLDPKTVKELARVLARIHSAKPPISSKTFKNWEKLFDEDSPMMKNPPMKNIIDKKYLDSLKEETEEIKAKYWDLLESIEYLESSRLTRELSKKVNSTFVFSHSDPETLEGKKMTLHLLSLFSCLLLVIVLVTDTQASHRLRGRSTTLQHPRTLYPNKTTTISTTPMTTTERHTLKPSTTESTTPKQTTPKPKIVTTPKPSPITTPKPSPVTTPKPNPITTPKPSPITTPKPNPITTPKPNPITTPKPKPPTTPKPNPITTPKPSPITTPKPNPITTPKPKPPTTQKPKPITTPKPSPVTTPRPKPITTSKPKPITTPKPHPVTTPKPRPPTTQKPKPITTQKPTHPPTSKPKFPTTTHKIPNTSAKSFPTSTHRPTTHDYPTSTRPTVRPNPGPKRGSYELIVHGEESLHLHLKCFHFDLDHYHLYKRELVVNASFAASPKGRLNVELKRLEKPNKPIPYFPGIPDNKSQGAKRSN